MWELHVQSPSLQQGKSEAVATPATANVSAPGEEAGCKMLELGLGVATVQRAGSEKAGIKQEPEATGGFLVLLLCLLCFGLAHPRVTS